MDRHYEPCPGCGKAKKNSSALCRACRPSYERTPEHRQKMSEVLAGRQPRGTGWRHSPKTRRKIASAWTPEKREAARIRGLRMASDPGWRRRIGEAVSGEKNPSWENGRAQIPYAPGWGRVNRRQVREEAGHRCEDCGGPGPLDTHHIDGTKSNHARNNLRALCRKCHKRAHAALRPSTRPRD
jgi:hypothetical protein